MKICAKCNLELNLTEFYKCKVKKDGLDIYCKSCKKPYNQNRDYKKYNATSGKIWKEQNPDFVKNYGKQYRKDNMAYYISKMAERRVAKLNGTVKWSDSAKILKIYETARLMTKEHNVCYEVDHIIPLIHPLVCGLHVENNLQIITKHDNRLKWNNFEPQFIVNV